MIARRRVPRRAARSRAGAVILYVVVAILAASLIGAALVQTALLQRRELQTQRQRSQAAWLADSALDRALARLSRDGTYGGETWKPQVATSATPQPAEIVITVTPAADDPQRRAVEAVCLYPVGAVREQRVRRRCTVQLQPAAATTADVRTTSTEATQP